MYDLLQILSHNILKWAIHNRVLLLDMTSNWWSENIMLMKL